MKLNDLITTNHFFRENLSPLDRMSMANMLDVVNKGTNSYFNLCKNVSFNTTDIDESLYQSYYVQETDTWTGISHKFYESYKLWWLICKFNGIRNPFNPPTAGSMIKVPTRELVDTILTVMKQQ